MGTLKRLKSRKLEEMTQFDESRSFYEANWESLLRQYEGKYVAILDQRVIDSDVDFSRLAERVFKRVGYRDIYMPKVQRKAKVVSIPSPQRVSS